MHVDVYHGPHPNRDLMMIMVQMCISKRMMMTMVMIKMMMKMIRC